MGGPSSRDDMILGRNLQQSNGLCGEVKAQDHSFVCFDILPGPAPDGCDLSVPTGGIAAK